jgi:hypothetical protein
MAVRTGGLFIPGDTNHTVARPGNLPARPPEKEAVRPRLPAQPEICPPPGIAQQIPPTIVVQNGNGGPSSGAAENRPTKQESPRPQTTTPQTTTPQTTTQETTTQETTRHEQGERRPATPRRTGEPIVREEKGVVAAVQRIVGASPDDMWGDRTSEALQRRIMKFQDENGLPVTGRYDPETAKRMRVHSDTETKDLANALDAVKNLRQYYRLAPVHTVTETVETKKEGEGVAPAAPTTPAPEAAAPTPATAPEASNKTPAASAAPPKVPGVGPVQTADGHGDVGVCTVPSALSTLDNSNPPAVKGEPEAGTPPAAGTNPFIAGKAVLLPYNLDTKPPETRDLLYRSGDPKPELRTMENYLDPSSNPKPNWMNAAAELGAVLKVAGGKMEGLPQKVEFAHGVTVDASVHDAASFVGMA